MTRDQPTFFKATIAYDGSAYAGWQVQPGQLTVQGKLEDAVAGVSGNKVGDRRARVTASGRTDAGVHALAQVVSFSVATDLADDVWVRALNAYLPDDIRVLAVEAKPSFHALREATGKRYRYVIHDAETPNLFHRSYAWRIAEPLKLAPMRQAAEHLLGRHDFSSFEAAGAPRASSVRTIRDLTVRRCDFDPGLVWIEVEADGFLYNMVRNIVGALALVGREKKTPEWVREVLACRDRRRAAATAPAQGLFLLRVDYEEAVSPTSTTSQAGQGGVIQGDGEGATA
jgi:tRNA pseudouridine38-40 synthase